MNTNFMLDIINDIIESDNDHLIQNKYKSDIIIANIYKKNYDKTKMLLNNNYGSFLNVKNIHKMI
jgi:hypothetical protein